MASTKNPPRNPAHERDGDALMARIDRALARWPYPGADAGASDAKAAAIVTAARRGAEAGEADAGDADVLAPPVPHGAEDPEAPGPSRDAPRAWVRRGVLAAAAVVAMAAGFLVLRPRSDAGDPTLAPGVAVGAWPAVAASAWLPAPPANVDRGVDPSTLPLAAGASAERAGAPASAAPRHAAGAARAPSPAAGPVQDPTVAASPAADEALRPAAAVAAGSGVSADPWNVPRRPSVGAVQAAFGAALPAARACLGPGDPAYHAMVTFQADGTVRAVALGDTDPPKGDCVRAALGKASVPPFAEDSYVAPVTVRDLGR